MDNILKQKTINSLPFMFAVICLLCALQVFNIVFSLILLFTCKLGGSRKNDHPQIEDITTNTYVEDYSPVKEEYAFLDYHSKVYQTEVEFFQNVKGSFQERIIEVIAENYNNPSFDISDLCQEMGQSKSSLYYLCSELFGRSPARLLLDYRLVMSYSLLREEPVRINEACFKCGFISPSNFSRQFNHKFKIRPTSIPAIYDTNKNYEIQIENTQEQNDTV